MGAQAQFCDTEVTQISPTFQAQFGGACSIEGNIAIVGAVQAQGGISCTTGGAGSATVFQLIDGAWTTVVELQSPNPECGGQFGYEVAVAGDTIIVGAPFETSNGIDNAGRAYVFRNQAGSWVLTQVLTELTQFTGSRFGHSVDASGTRAVISAVESDFFGNDAGAAYIYRQQGGQLIFEDRVAPNPISANGFFGTSVSIFGDYLAVGAVFDSQVAFQAGATYVFERQPNTTWIEDVKLTAPVAQVQSFFGIATDLRGDFLVVGAEGVDNLAQSDGAAYVYRRDSLGLWSLEAELASPSPDDDRTFGRSVSYSGLQVMVTDIAEEGGGAAFVFDRTGPGQWVFGQTLVGIGQLGSDAFGVDGVINEGRAIVGALLRSTSATFSGAAFIFNLDFEDCDGNLANDACELSQDPSLDCDGDGVLDICQIATDSSLDCDMDGRLDSCQIAGNNLLDCDGNGLIDICEIAANSALDCNNNGALDTCDTANGMAPDINGNSVPDDCEPIGTNPNCQTVPNSTGVISQLRGVGSPSVLANDIVLIGSEMPANSFGYPIVSRSPASTIPPNSVGFRCVGGSVGRDFSNIFNTGGTGGAVLPIDVMQIPTPNGLASAVAGETWYWQLWHRDSFSGQSTSTFTDSLMIDFQ